MAHLTIRLGGSVTVPCRIPRGWRGHPRARAVRLRWQSLCEAAIVAVDRDLIGSSYSFPDPRSTEKSRRHRTLGFGRDSWS
jgi:hypothetical protein